jgi:hypothetical protein
MVGPRRCDPALRTVAETPAYGPCGDLTLLHTSERSGLLSSCAPKHAREFQLMVEAGMPAMEAIKAATIAPVKFLRPPRPRRAASGSASPRRTDCNGHSVSCSVCVIFSKSAASFRLRIHVRTACNARDTNAVVIHNPCPHIFQLRRTTPLNPQWPIALLPPRPSGLHSFARERSFEPEKRRP